MRKSKNKAKKKLNEFETFETNQPIMPDYTCPHIDDVIDWSHKIIDKMEDIRKMNTQLRENAEYWRDSCEEMQDKLDDMRMWKQNLQNMLQEDI
tara:strand:+ start:31262 stop:31543 length:282 start_codon:yes stop_codon:yes gene_type:complete